MAGAREKKLQHMRIAFLPAPLSSFAGLHPTSLVERRHLVNQSNGPMANVKSLQLSRIH
jgi:hypothetical protein